MLLLNREDKVTVRSFAADAYQKSGGDVSSAKQLVKSDIRKHMKQKYGSIIATVLISIAIRLAIALIKHWIENNVTIPAKTYKVGEPGYDSNI